MPTLFLTSQATALPIRAPHKLFHAFIIGNNAYPTCPLTKCENDADDMAALLSAKGFNVTKHKNVSRFRFTREFAKFTDTLVDGSTVAVHYSGHALEINGENHCLPIESEVSAASPEAGNSACSTVPKYLVICACFVCIMCIVLEDKIDQRRQVLSRPCFCVFRTSLCPQRSRRSACPYPTCWTS